MATFADESAQLDLANLSDAEGCWQALHIFIHDFAKFDAFLTECIGSLPKALLQQSFFVRYWYGGPHVRFRFRGKKWLPVVEAAVQKYLADHRFESTLVPEQYYLAYGQALEAEFGAGAERPWHSNGTVLSMPYEPELERYGGAEAMPAVEAQFVFDSLMMLKVVEQLPPVTRERLLFGCCLVCADVLRTKPHRYDSARIVKVLLPDDISGKRLVQHAEEKLEEQARAIEAVRRQWHHGNYFPDWLGPYESELSRLGIELAAAGVKDIGAIFSSLLHMSFNRAGIRPSREATIRYVAAKAIEARSA
ncbi:MAG: thiopeptide-type bacteriocin biosynthesis protein [Nevskia sp.]|jgi:hypothetical protein|nr:thiopeptide-type bacteriocin biosynthesis protein [Nevskia sp.]MCK9383134.1 thiopeptide-type bacteriocin biosynthesis protein [Nevskia sp.]